MTEKNVVVIVCGYGCHLNKNYGEYLEKVGCFAQRNYVEFIIVSGGFSQLETAPGRSEAMVMAAHLANFTDKEIIKEESALTTNDNLVFSKEILWARKISSQTHRLVIFCDAIRALKVAYLANRIFSEYEIEIETHQLSSCKAARRQVFMTLKDILGYHFSLLQVLDNWPVERRRQRI